MSTRKDQKIQKSHGQSLVEVALTLPLLLLLIFTFLDLGRAVYYYSAIGNAVREGARFASVTPLDLTDSDDQDEVKAVVQNYSIAVAIDSDLITFPTPEDPDPSDSVPFDPNDYVTVKATLEFAPVTPFLAQILGSGNTISLSSESTMLLAPIARN